MHIVKLLKPRDNCFAARKLSIQKGISNASLPISIMVDVLYDSVCKNVSHAYLQTY